MPSISYSSNALDTLDKFHQCKYIIYVEDKEDQGYWSNIFEVFGLTSFYIKPAGGCEEIEKYSRAIINDNVNIYIARDSDYREILGNQFLHPHIIWSYGYSIENSLYHPKNIHEFIVSCIDRNHYDFTIVEKWIEDFSVVLNDLLILDIASVQNKKGIRVFGDNCFRLLEGTSPNLSPTMCNNLYTEKLHHFTDSELLACKKKIKKALVSKPLFFYIRGHFLTNAVFRFVKSEIQRDKQKTFRLSEDEFFYHLLAIFKFQCYSNTTREDIFFLRRQITTWLDQN